MLGSSNYKNLKLKPINILSFNMDKQVMLSTKMASKNIYL